MKSFLIVCSLVMLTISAQSAEAALVNDDFEDNANFAVDWSPGGTVTNPAASAASIAAGFDSRHARIDHSGTALPAVSLGTNLSTSVPVNTFNQISALSGIDFTDFTSTGGSYITQSFTGASAGQAVSFQYNFLTNETGVPPDATHGPHTAFAFWSFTGPGIVDESGNDSNFNVDNLSSPGDGELLGISTGALLDGTGTGFAFQTGVQTVSFLLPGSVTGGDTFDISFAALSTRGTAFNNSTLLVDNITVALPVSGVPEPSSFVLLGMAGLGGVFLRRRSK